MRLTPAAAEHGKEQVAVLVWRDRPVLAVGRHNLELEDLVCAVTVRRAQEVVSPAGRPTAIGADGVTAGHHHRHIVSLHVTIQLPRLDTRADASRAPTVRTGCEFGKILKLLEEMCPNA